jgi:hypothetical protein
MALASDEGPALAGTGPSRHAHACFVISAAVPARVRYLTDSEKLPYDPLRNVLATSR